MEDFNKVLSFILGLVVVVVFIIVLTNRLNLRGKILPLTFTTPKPSVITPSPKKQTGGFFSFLKRPTPTPTPTKSLARKPTPTSYTNYQTGKPLEQTKGGLSQVATIPSTGSPTLLLSLFGASSLLGFYLRKRK